MEVWSHKLKENKKTTTQHEIPVVNMKTAV